MGATRFRVIGGDLFSSHRGPGEAEALALPDLRTTIFYDWNMRDDPGWITHAVDALSDTVYVTIDLDGLDAALMPAVGTPEPGGLSWRETTTLLRHVFERRRVVACDVVELCPVPGLVSPNFVAARLVYKLLGYHAAAERARVTRSRELLARVGRVRRLRTLVYDARVGRFRFAGLSAASGSPSPNRRVPQLRRQNQPALYNPNHFHAIDAGHATRPV